MWVRVIHMSELQATQVTLEATQATTQERSTASTTHWTLTTHTHTTWVLVWVDWDTSKQTDPYLGWEFNKVSGIRKEFEDKTQAYMYIYM